MSNQSIEIKQQLEKDFEKFHDFLMNELEDDSKVKQLLKEGQNNSNIH